MNAAHLHLIINHFPVILPLVGLPIFLSGKIRKIPAVKSIALWIFAASAIITIPVYLTGDPAADIVRNLHDVSPHDIHEHDEAATYALIMSEILGVLSIVMLWIEKRKKITPPIFDYAIIFMTLFSFSVVARTAYLGGQIRHEEIRDKPNP